MDYGPPGELAGKHAAERNEGYRVFVEGGLAEDDEEMKEAPSSSGGSAVGPPLETAPSLCKTGKENRTLFTIKGLTPNFPGVMFVVDICSPKVLRFCHWRK